MSALPDFAGTLRPMTMHDLDAVFRVERTAYEFPWTLGNFRDSLGAGHAAEVLCDPGHRLVGYFVAMKGVDEMHLLNLTVAPQEQARGRGRVLLDRVVALARHHAAHQVWLEVRRQNERAQRIYTRFGFTTNGFRRAYYPAALGQREDAILMSLSLRSLPESSS